MNKWKLTSHGRILVVGIILIIAYKIINNFEDIWSAFGTVLSTMGPFFAGILIAFFVFVSDILISSSYNKTVSQH